MKNSTPSIYTTPGNNPAPYAAVLKVDHPDLLETVLGLYRFSAILIVAVAASERIAKLQAQFRAENVIIIGTDLTSGHIPLADVSISQNLNGTVICAFGYPESAISLPHDISITMLRDAVSEALCIPLLSN